MNLDNKHVGCNRMQANFFDEKTQLPFPPILAWRRKGWVQKVEREFRMTMFKVLKRSSPEVSIAMGGNVGFDETRV